MEIEKIKHLFVPSEERMPEDGVRCIILTKNKGHESCYGCYDKEVEEFKIDSSWLVIQKQNVTHWLDLSILIKKEDALDCMDCHCVEGYCNTRKKLYNL